MSQLFESKTWTGEFFHPDLFEGRFAGTLAYSPDRGVVLTYRKADDTKIPDTNVLHGILETGEMCTLFGDFSLAGSGGAVKNGLQTQNGRCGFRMLVVGNFLPADFVADDICFQLCGLQDFLAHRGAREAAKFEKDAIQTTALPFGSLEVRTAATFGPLPPDVSALVYCDDLEAQRDLVSGFADTQKRHPTAHFMLKQTLEYRLRLRLAQPEPILSAYRHISDISNLLALLLDSPTHPEAIDVVIKEEDDRHIVLNLYPALGLNPATVKLAQRERHHQLLPISGTDIKLEDVLAPWLTSDAKESILVSAMQHEIGFRTEHTAHGDIILFASQLESISYSAGRQREKYEYPITTYGTSNLLAALERPLQATGIKRVGAAISELRNEIAHVGRPRVHLERMTLRELMNVGRCLQLVLAAFSLERIGIPKVLSSKYVNKLLPR